MRKLALRHSRRQRHRGPDWSGIRVSPQAIFAHERLAIVDMAHGAQPLINQDGDAMLAVNGEIYNHRALRQGMADYAFATASDCEVILPLYQQHGVALLTQLNGMFAFALSDDRTGNYLVARDPIGIIPLYYGHDEHGQLLVASELKAIADLCRDAAVFPPGHYLTPDDTQPQPYFQPAWRAFAAVDGSAVDATQLRQALEASVIRHMMSDVPYGVLLSGGLDSSIIAAMAAQHAAKRIEDDERSPAWWPQLHSFAIGLAGSPDLAAAQQVADAIGTVHHGFTFTIEEGLDALEEVIYHLETFDVTTIRAATPMFLMARKIRAMGIKMVLSGEGADEIFGGYLYFHKAPNAQAFHEETVRKLDRLHHYDCLRANKAMAAWGVEARVPFLDREFLDVAMRVDPQAKLITAGRMEKQILREACAELLPDAIAWRQKEQFSDGVGYGWIDALRDHCAAQVSDEQLKRTKHRFGEPAPSTHEAYYYRSIFEQHFPQAAAIATVPVAKSIACSTPEALAWDAAFANQDEPSGRAVKGVHQQAYRG